MKRGYVYIMTNGPSGTLYIGVTSAIAARVAQHRAGTGSEFCKRYGLTRLVHVESYDSIVEAIAREKQLKAWQRAWKLNLSGGPIRVGATCSLTFTSPDRHRP